jgi:hypothetical protein
MSLKLTVIKIYILNYYKDRIISKIMSLVKNFYFKEFNMHTKLAMTPKIKFRLDKAKLVIDFLER